MSASEADLAIQRALAAAVDAYAERVLEGGDLPPFPGDHEVSQTAVAVTAAAMLKMAEVYSFELAAMFNV
jgi:hypothetical protein